jgi:hypothetical protein
MSDDRLREALKVAVTDLRQRWETGAPKGDSYELGFNAGLWNALSLMEEVAQEAGLNPAEIGLEEGWADPE